MAVSLAAHGSHATRTLGGPEAPLRTPSGGIAVDT